MSVRPLWLGLEVRDQGILLFLEGDVIVLGKTRHDEGREGDGSNKVDHSADKYYYQWPSMCKQKLSQRLSFFVYDHEF